MLSLLFSLAMLTADSDTGSIWIRTEPGVVVYLDGVMAGVSVHEQGGLWLHGVKPGVHDVRVEVAGAGSSTMKIQVEVGEIVTVPVSSLGIRANDVRRKGELEIRVTAPRAGCMAKFGDRRRSLPHSGAIFDGVTSGRHRLVISCGSRAFQRDLEIPAGRSILVDANLLAGSLSVADDRPLRTQIEVKSTRDEVLRASVSAQAKRALNASLTPEIQVLALSEALGRVYLEIEAPNSSAASYFLDRFRKRPEIDEIIVGNMEMRNVRAILRLNFSIR